MVKPHSWGSQQREQNLKILASKLQRVYTRCQGSRLHHIVRPVLEYASTIWDPHRQGDIKALDQVQRRAARYVCIDYTSRNPGCVTTMIKYIGWDSLQDRRYIAWLSLLYKMQHGLVDVDSTRYLKLGDTRTRGRCFFQEIINSEVYYNSFFPCTSREWNELPEDVTAATSMEEFRTSLARRLVHA